MQVELSEDAVVSVVTEALKEDLSMIAKDDSANNNELRTAIITILRYYLPSDEFKKLGIECKCECTCGVK